MSKDKEMMVGVIGAIAGFLITALVQRRLQTVQKHPVAVGGIKRPIREYTKQGKLLVMMAPGEA